MTDEHYGTILSVDTRNLGESTTQALTAGAVTLYVEDAATFDEAGGLVLVGGVSYPYLFIDVDLNTLGLLVALAADLPEGSLVEAIPTTPIKTAMIDLGGDGDAIPLVVPHALVEALPDGVRAEGVGETVLCTIINGDLTLANIVGQPLVKGAIDPSRIGVGVVGNLVQEPDFLDTDLWSPGEPWSIVGPDTTYPDYNFARSQNDGTYGTDVDFYLTDYVPVETGQTVRVAGLVRASSTSDTVTSGGQTRARVRVELFKPDGITRLTTNAQLKDFLTNADLDLDQWTEVEGTFTVPEGYTSVRAKFQSTFQDAGTIDYIKPSVQVLWNRVQSSNYVEGDSGWALDDEASQVQNLNVISDLGADTITTNELTVGGLDILDLLDDSVGGLVAFNRGVSGVNTGEVGSTRTVLFEQVATGLEVGYIYRIHVHGHIEGTDAGDAFDLHVGYTKDGSTPSSSAAIVDGSLTRVNIPTVPSTSFNIFAYYVPTEDIDVLRLTLCLDRVAGSGTAHLTNSDINRSPEFALEKVGVNGNNVGVLTQRSKVTTGSPPADPEPVGTYTKSWPVIWSRSYDGNNGTRDGDDTADLYQGYYSGTHGNTRSLMGFDDAGIRAALAGATIVSVKLKFRVKHAYYGAGLHVLVSSGNYSAKPSTWAEANVVHARGDFTGCKSGSTYTKALPVAVGNEFKSGTTKCLGFGNGTTNSKDYYGYMYGNGSASEPILTITYTK